MDWYVARNGQQLGPVSWDALLIAVAKGDLLPEDLVWAPGMKDWSRASDIASLFTPPPIAAPAAVEQKPPPPAGSPTIENPLDGDPSPLKDKVGFIKAHWHGDVSLARAYWLHGVAISIAATLVIMAYTDVTRGEALTAREAGIRAVIILTALTVLTVWQLVGIWCSATKHVGRGGKRGWAVLAKVAVVVAALGAAANLLPVGVEVLKISTQGDDIPPPKFSILRNGTELELSGGLPFGSTNSLKQFLEAGPNIRVLHLNSQGGRIGEGAAMHKIIRERDLTTYASAECVSACTIAFLGGTRRYLSQNARLGFHSASIGGAGEEQVPGLNDDMRRSMLASGVSASFVERALGTKPESMWYPSHQELISAGVITAVVNPKDFALSGIPRDNKQLIDEIFSRVPIFAIIKEHDGKAYSEFIATFMEGIKIGSTPEEITSSVKPLLHQKLIPKYVKIAPDLPLIRYWRSQIAEMRYLLDKSPEMCVDFVLPHLAKKPIDLYAVLPQALIDEDMNSLGEVIKQGAMQPQSSAATPETERDMVLVFQSFASQYPKLVDVAIDPAKHKDAVEVCTAMINFYSEVVAIEPGRSGPLLRHLMSLEDNK